MSSKAGVSPGKRSVSSNGDPKGSKSTPSLPIQPVPNNLALELEVFCKPFTLWQLLKGGRFLPTPKRRRGKPHLSSSSSTCLPSALRCGRVQCVVSRGGLPGYSLIMDETEEIFAAKTLRVDGGLEEGVSHVYAFYSYKGKAKGKGKSGCRQWRKKEKPGSDFVGNMTVTSRISPLLSSNGVGNFVESEFVLFDAKVKEIPISGPTPTSPYSRSSFSSWDTFALQSSPNGPFCSFYSSPNSNSTYFSATSPTGACSTSYSTPVNRVGTSTSPSSVSSRSNFSGGTPAGGPISLDKLLSHLSLSCPLPKMSNLGSPESTNDLEIPNECESQAWAPGRPQSQAEVAAVVVRIPLEKTLGMAARARDKWGWGTDFLRSLDTTRNGSSPNQRVATGDSPGSKDGPRENAFTTDHLWGRSSTDSCDNFSGGSWQDKSGATGDSPGSKDWARENAFTTGAHMSGRSSTDSCTNFTEQLCGACGSTSGVEQSQGGTNVTLILPSGEHGCTANGIDGPQPLIERWRSGGKCDCGSWDLGCGLTIAGNHRIDTVDPKEQLRDSTLRLYVEGNSGPGFDPTKERVLHPGIS